jgi:hypothetical protein
MLLLTYISYGATGEALRADFAEKRIDSKEVSDD